MGVVDVDGHLVGEVEQGSVGGQMVGDDGLQGRGHQEVLLGQAQELALVVVVGGIEHLGDDLGAGGLLHGLEILALGEQVHVEGGGLHGLPQPEHVHALAVIPGHHHVVGHRPDLPVVVVGDGALAVLPGLVDLTAQTDVEGLVGPGNQPRGPLVHPAVGQLHLVAVDDALLEQAVLIADGEPGGRIVQRGQGVHEAGRQTSQTAVAQAWIRLHLVDFVQILPHGGESLPVFLLQAQVHQIVLQLPAHEEFHAQVVHPLRMGLLDPVVDHLALGGQKLLDGQGRGLEDLILGGLVRGNAEMAGQLRFDAGPHRVLVQIVVLIHTQSPVHKNAGVRAENPDAGDTITVLYPLYILLQIPVNINVSFCRNIP